MTSRIIPATMATQHPDNASTPFWERDGDGFVGTYEEVKECFACFQDLDVDEFMWDWEGKFADEGVVDKLFTRHLAYFKKHPLGKKKFLTFRLPNIWKEKGYSLIRAMMVILTSEDFARDARLHSPPLFEVILPMLERADQLMYIQRSFQKLAWFKAESFDWRKNSHTEQLDVIPLFEGVWHQIGARAVLEDYAMHYRKHFKQRLHHLRPFLARSDPALISGILANVLANKIALSEIERFGRAHRCEMNPIIGTGSLVFRGGLNPRRLDTFYQTYAGVRTVTIQSAFRYDFPIAQARSAIQNIQRNLPRTKTQLISETEVRVLSGIVRSCERIYQQTLVKMVPDIEPFFTSVPARRERRLHIGFLAYARGFGRTQLPRAINFTAGLYSIGVPPEFIGTGRALASLNLEEKRILEKYYPALTEDLQEAGRYINRDNLMQLAKKNSVWELILEDIVACERYVGKKIGPRSQIDSMHKNITSNTLLVKNNQALAQQFIIESGKLRHSLG